MFSLPQAVGFNLWHTSFIKNIKIFKIVKDIVKKITNDVKIFSHIFVKQLKISIKNVL